MSHARSLHSCGWLLGLLVFVSGLAEAVDCTGDPATTPTPTPFQFNNLASGCGFTKSGGTGPVGPYSSIGEAQAAVIASSFLGTPGTGTASTVTYCGVQNGGDTYDLRFLTSGGSPKHFPIRRGVGTNTCDVPDPEPELPCADMQGQKALGGATGVAHDYVPPETRCVGGCETYRKDQKNTGGDRKWFRMKDSPTTASVQAYYEFTGMECDGNEADSVPAEDVVQEDQGERCVGQFCQSVNTGENCGYFNDKYTCVDSIQPDKCQRNGDGSASCAAGAPTPPKPDNGTPGVPAPPNNSVEACTGSNSCQEINYYNTVTVTGSSRPMPTGSNPDGSGVVDGSGPVEEETPSGSASGGAGCDAAPVCDGDPIGCATLAQAWRARCVDAPSPTDLENTFGPATGEDGEFVGSETREIGDLLDSSTGWMGAGACIQDYSLDLGGMLPTVEIPFSEWCWLLEIIGIFTMLAAYVSGARIIIGGI